MVDKRRIIKLEERLDPNRRKRWLTVTDKPLNSTSEQRTILSAAEWDELFSGRYPMDPEGGDNAPRRVQQLRWLNMFGRLTSAELASEIKEYLAAESEQLPAL